MGGRFPYLLVRLPAVARSHVLRFAYDRTLGAAADAPDIEARFHSDSERRDPELVAALQSEPFLTALQESNPELGRRVARLPRAAASTMRKKERQTLRAAVRYLWRAALRPIPCGRFCGTGVARIGETVEPRPADLSRRGSIYQASAARIAAAEHALFAIPEAAQSFRIYATPLLWKRAGGALYYWSMTGASPAPVPGRFQQLVAAVAKEPGRRRAEWEGEFGAAVEAAVQAGVLEAHPAKPGEDRREAAMALLWHAMPRHFELLDHIAAIAAEDSSRSGAKGSGAHCDTYLAKPLRIHAQPMSEFFRIMAEYGSYTAESASPEARAAGELLRLVQPSGEPIPAIDFYHECARLARERHIRFEGAEWLDLARSVGIEIFDAAACEAGRLAGRMNTADSVDLRAPERWMRVRSAPARMCFRFRRAPGPPGSTRFHLAFYGGGRMSLLPRYENLPFEPAGVLGDAVRRWFERWPELAEVYGGFRHDADSHRPATARTIQFPCAPPQRGAVPFGALRVAPREADGVPELIDVGGRPIRPVFFGVTAETALPPLMRFALSIGHPEMSLLEAVCRVVQGAVARAVAEAGSAVRALPEITLAGAVVLSPKLWVVPRRSAPQVGSPVSARGFAEFHAWLRRAGLPRRVAQAGPPGEEPQCLDLGHPEGANNFLRLLRAAEVVLVAGSWLSRDEDGLRGEDGWYEPEYYAEVAAGCDEHAPSAGAERCGVVCVS